MGMSMKTTMSERLRRAALGLLLIVGGYVFVWPLQFLSFFSGLMLFGFAIDTRGTEFPEDDARPMAMEKQAAPAKSAPRRKASRKKKAE
jgi:hypothetical protein